MANKKRRSNKKSSGDSAARNGNGRQQTDKPFLAPHLEQFAKAVAKGASHVAAAVMVGRRRGSASFLYAQPGVKERIADLAKLARDASEEEAAKSKLKTISPNNMDHNEIAERFAAIARSPDASMTEQIRALSHLAEMEKVRTQPKEEGRASAPMAAQTPEDAAWIEAATRDPFTWTTLFTETYNEHWVEEGRPSQYEKFPPYDYLLHLFVQLEMQEITWIEKSRDMMISWACVAYLTLNAMKVPYRGILLQTQKDDKVIQLVDYAKTLYKRQDPRLIRAFPLAKPIDRQPDHSLNFANGSYIVGIPGGADQIRSYHPWGYLNDESSFQADAGECYNEALSAVKGKIIFNSSAGPGWYADARRDIIRSEE
jgi:hypothetical protein